MANHLNGFRMFISLFGGTLTLILLVSLCNIYIIKYSKDKCYDCVEAVPYNHVGLLLGTSPRLSDGSENLYFTYRIDAAVALYKAGKIKYILVSGDNSRNTYNEPEEMKNALIAKGIPESVIYPDYAGFRTLDSVVRAKMVFGQDRFTVISQRFHNERAIYLAGKNDIDAIGFNARDVDAKAGFKTRVREVLARVKVYIDLVFNKKPKFLGEPVQIP